MTERNRIFSAGIIDFNPRRMTSEQIQEHGIPRDLVDHLADLRQYPVKIADFLPHGTLWFSPDKPWFFRSVMSDSEKLGKLQKSDVLILSGSGMSAYMFQEGRKDFFPNEDWAHLEKSEEVVRDHLGDGKWVLGICFGGQLSMHAVGATLGKLPNNPNGHTVTEAGWLPHQLTPEGKKDEVFRDLPDTFYAAHFHSDFVKTLPEVGARIQTSNGEIEVVRAEVLATRQGFLGKNGLENEDETYTHAAVVEFDNGSRLYHIQPHPEMAKPGRADFFIRKAGWWLSQEDEMGEKYAERAREISVADFSISTVITRFAEAYKKHMGQEYWSVAAPAIIGILRQYLEE